MSACFILVRYLQLFNHSYYQKKLMVSFAYTSGYS